MSVRIHFLPDNITVWAEPGDSLLAVAKQAGILIPTGCLMGSCHACEVEIEGSGAVCACITSVPPIPESLNIHLYSDPSWE